MSGIFGFWNLDGRPADPEVLAAMSTALAHRGPDGWAAWCEGPVAIGHRMFQTTPESVYEHQPRHWREGTRVLTADVRLDNRVDLIARFGLATRIASTVPDADLLVRAHERFGRGAPEQLVGAFAYAVWDAASRELHCARDHFGEKPLYYFHSPGRLFAFASEIKALWALREVPRDIDDLEVARHLLVPVPDDLGSTYYTAVRRLTPGHTLTVTPLGFEERRYWTLDDVSELTLSSDAEYADAVRETFTEAVRCRLRARGPIASMLSGGLDSSSVSCVAARLLHEGGLDQLRTLSAVYPDCPASDERRYIDWVVAEHPVEPSFFRADNVSPVADVDHLNWHADGASKAGNLYLNWTLYNVASTSGARVVLDGYDGDSTLSHGDGWLVELASSRRWWRLAREVKARADMIGESWPSALRAWFMAYGVAPALRSVSRAVRPRRTPRLDTSTTPSWAHGLSADFRERISTHIAAAPPAPRTEREHHRRLMMRPILLQTLDLIEATGAAAGVEVRTPFFDVRLVKLCVSLPAEQKLRRGWSRWVMREAMTGILPESIRRRGGKSNMEPGFHQALHTHGGEQLTPALWNAADRFSSYLDSAYCAQLHQRAFSGAASSEEALRSWRHLSLALWLMGNHGAYTARAPLDGKTSPVAASRGPTPQEV